MAIRIPGLLRIRNCNKKGILRKFNDIFADDPCKEQYNRGGGASMTPFFLQFVTLVGLYFGHFDPCSNMPCHDAFEDA